MKSKITVGMLVVASALPAIAVPINLSSSATPYSQNFNSLATSGTANSWANGSTIAGWHLFTKATPAAAVSTYRAGAGTSATGGFYSFGSDSDRALGGIGSGTVSGYIAAQFLNNSGSSFNGFNAHWAGEQWRNSGNASAHSMMFQYGIGNAFDSLTWQTPGSEFTWSTPVTGGTAASVNGNTVGRVNDVGGTITGLNWKDGETLWLRWIENDDSGTDHGL
ncbi:MAG: IPTL-CTERM sorting domain-containing protein, partial [Akkermansiaceae bacterium]|nr:IPTL-CTERM sorting domain-containing protein [Verrucomicrobiales bacterium]